MHHHPAARPRARFLPLLLMASLPLAAQTPGIANGDFENDAVGAAPAGWFASSTSRSSGYRLAVVADGAHGGARCVELRAPGTEPVADAASGAAPFGNCMLVVDATEFRGKRVRFQAWVRVAADDGSRAQLWLRVDRPDATIGFFDNMDDRPIERASWRRYAIVGDVAEDAQHIALGMMLNAGSAAWLDDATLEVVDTRTPRTGRMAQVAPAPGLANVQCAFTATVRRDVDATTLLLPLPLAYRDQTPLTFALTVEPATADAAVRLRADDGPNRVLELELRDLQVREQLRIHYQATMLVAPTSFAGLPKSAAFPAEWPAEARPWLAASWCCDADDARIRALAAELRKDDQDVLAVIDRTLRRSQQVFAAASGRVDALTAVEALDRQGSCTSCANLVAALLRAANVPARVLAGYPLWSGPLQTHYLVEAYVPGFGWYPLESTQGKAAWPNHQQIQVRIVPPEHEHRDVAGGRFGIAGGVPYLSLTEQVGDPVLVCEGTLKPFCDHAAEFVRAIDAEADAWQQAQGWARERWAQWLASAPQLRNGRLVLGPEVVAAKTLADLQRELQQELR